LKSALHKLPDAEAEDPNLHPALESVFAQSGHANLKQKSVRSGVAAMVSQGLKFGLQTGSTVALARLLSPEDFGLQGMVVAVTGFLSLFRDAGLSMATVQREVITHKQTSTLFWINAAVGVVLLAFCVALAPVLVAFYKEPRLYWMTIISGVAFLFTGLAAQHQALLQRGMRFVTIAKIDVIALAISSGVGIGMAVLKCGYWSLVGMTASAAAASAVGAWLAMKWRPGLPHRGSGVRSMLHFGGTVTLNGLVTYVAYNTEKILLGRYCGAAQLGIYGRAYQLVSLPFQQLNSSVGSVAFPALSRIQSDPARLRRSFLKGYSLLLSMCIPVTLTSAVFADEIVRVVLGPKWSGAAPLLQYLAPTVIVFALINPFGWFLQATGRIGRSLYIAFLIAPVVVIGIAAGLPFGTKGVAIGYSSALVVLMVPTIVWAIRGTGISGRDIWNSARLSIFASLGAAATGLAIKYLLESHLTPFALLAVGLTLSIAVYAWVLLIVMGQKKVYLDLLGQLSNRAKPVPEELPAI
jgi:O-antigen/teichoic acid export membrane protein